MDLVGVVYHNGRTVHSGHYTCLCRGPGGGFWYYDDDHPRVKMSQEIAHIMPRQVPMVVYARREQRWSTDASADGGDDLRVNLVDGCDAAGGDMDGGSVGGVGGVGVGADGGSSSSGGGANDSVVMQFEQVRLVPESGSPGIQDTVTPERESKRRCLGFDEANGIDGVERGFAIAGQRGSTPQSRQMRRLRRKTSPGDEGGLCAHISSASSPLSPIIAGRCRSVSHTSPARRLVRKTSQGDDGDPCSHLSSGSLPTHPVQADVGQHSVGSVGAMDPGKSSAGTSCARGRGRGRGRGKSGGNVAVGAVADVAGTRDVVRGVRRGAVAGPSAAVVEATRVNAGGAAVVADVAPVRRSARLAAREEVR